MPNGGGTLTVNAEVASGDYYLYDTASKVFLSRGANWGTEATVDKYGLCIHYDTDTKKISFIDWANTTMFLVAKDGASVYTDGGGKKSTFEVIESDGGYIIKATADENGTAVEKYLRHDNGNLGEYVHAVDDQAEATVWTLKSKDEHDKMLAGYVSDNIQSVISKAGMSTTVDNFVTTLQDSYKGVDVSSKINNTGFTWNKVRQDNSPNTTAVESYQSTGTWTQSVTGLEKGLYKVTFHGLDRYGSYTDVTTQGKAGYENVTSFVRANNEDVLMPSWYSDFTGTSNPNTVAEGQAAFAAGKYEQSVYTYVDEDGKLDLSVNIPSYKGSRWVMFNNWALTYYTDQMSSEDIEAIKNDVAAVIDSPMEATYKTALQAAQKQFNVSSTIANYNNLNVALKEAKASIDAYAALLTRLEGMSELMKKNTFVTKAAKDAYMSKYTEAKTKYEAGTITTAEALKIENPYVVTGWRASNDADDYLVSAWNVKPETWSDYHLNTWSTEGNSDGTEFKVPFIEYWVGDGNVLGAKQMTATLTADDGIEANGLYKVSLWMRTRQTNNKTQDLSKITVDAGNAAVQMAEEKKSGILTLKHFVVYGFADAEANLKLTVNVEAGSNTSWVAWRDFCAEKVEPTLLDEASKDEIVASEGVPVVLKRTFVAGSWNTLVLPFDLSAEAVKSAFGDDVKVMAFSDDTDASLVHFKNAETIQANVPVLIKTNTTEGEFTFENVKVDVSTPVAIGTNGNWNLVGTYKAETYVPAKSYELYGDKWYVSKGNANYVINGYRAYIAPVSETAAAKGVSVVIGDVPTAIENVVADVAEDGTVYNLAGQRMGKLAKGINIKDGKKILVK